MLKKTTKENTLDRVAAELEARKDRSAWDKGVTVYALELVEELKERAVYEGRNPEPGAECREWMLNGAQDWAQYSWVVLPSFMIATLPKGFAPLPN